MTSVTQRIKAITQPRGGYVNPKTMEVRHLGGKPLALADENLPSSRVGLAVDYLTRLANGADPTDAFKVSLAGAAKLATLGGNPDGSPLVDVLADVNSMKAGRVTTGNIVTACRLVGYDAVSRGGYWHDTNDETIVLNVTTIEHIQTMVKRSVSFFTEYGPVTLDSFTFLGGYTPLVSTGDGDFLTEDALWDFKVSDKGPTSAHTLQLLIYYLMGQHSRQPEFSTIKNLGVFNPRLDTVYHIAVEHIPQNVVNQVSRDVIGYGLTRDELVECIMDAENAAIYKMYGLTRARRMPMVPKTLLARTLLGAGYQFTTEDGGTGNIAYLKAKCGPAFAEHVETQHMGPKSQPIMDTDPFSSSIGLVPCPACVDLLNNWITQQRAAGKAMVWLPAVEDREVPGLRRRALDQLYGEHLTERTEKIVGYVDRYLAVTASIQPPQ